ncbi:MAG TPA: electron transfer flavoprotein subunit beta/FixA family protein [Saprospiraceae bacterium]|nr:electron transfer flavoprotein subunit beta/FixA family protein [Saprospiraceae bacterium]HRG19963.1 electron transfer flavoprotein subunit beta/FixA family protein [Saprospiraceae bacterium]
MKILVCISKTPDTTSKISFVNNGKEFNSEGIQYIMNPYDEWYALVRAVELKEKNGGSVTVINVGDVSSEIVIRKALAIGADEAIRVDVVPESSLQVAKEIAAHAAGYDLVLTGKETIDYNGAEVGAMLAELLDLPYVSFAFKLEKEGEDWLVSREVEGGTETLKVGGPIVLSAAKGMAEQRIPNMQGIMMAKKKPLNVVASIGAEKGSVVASHEMPPAKSGVKMIAPDDMDTLVKLLHEEAKVI